MARCPDIDELELLGERDDPKIIKHAARCLACQAVLALFADRAPELDTPGCARVEILAAKRDATALSSVEEREIEEHTERCESCRLLSAGALPED